VHPQHHGQELVRQWPATGSDAQRLKVTGRRTTTTGCGTAVGGTPLLTVAGRSSCRQPAEVIDAHELIRQVNGRGHDNRRGTRLPESAATQVGACGLRAVELSGRHRCIAQGSCMCVVVAHALLKPRRTTSLPVPPPTPFADSRRLARKCATRRDSAPTRCTWTAPSFRRATR
jgi:hypothetical protein